MSISKTTALPESGPRLGAKVRALRRREALTQVQLAERLSISPSYLNLIEANRRPLPAGLLIRLAQLFRVDLESFAADDDARLVADLLEVFADPIFEAHSLTNADVREVAQASPQAARAVLALYRAYTGARESVESLSSKLTEGEEVAGIAVSALPSEQVSDFIQRRMNHFPELEEGAEALWRSAKLG